MSAFECERVPASGLERGDEITVLRSGAQEFARVTCVTAEAGTVTVAYDCLLGGIGRVTFPAGELVTRTRERRAPETVRVQGGVL